MAIFIAILGLGLLIVLHEAGHFIAARLCGMRVERFSIGFGPSLIGFKRGDTHYQIAPIPLGGFVQITGLNPHEEFDRNDPYVYPNRPRWMRVATVVAGPAANYITAMAIMLVVFASFGIPTPSKTLRVIEPVANKPAATAGMLSGDVLLEANGVAVSTDKPIADVIKASGGEPVVINALRDGKPISFTVKPEEVSPGEYQVGIQIGVVADRQRASAGETVAAAARYPFVMSGAILNGLWGMIRGEVKADVTGPVGITRQIAKAADRGAVEFLEILAILSVYLGLFNLLPLPALDGGRVLFMGVEWVTRGRVNPRVEAAVHMVGFVLLLGVLVIVTFKDIFLRG